MLNLYNAPTGGGSGGASAGPHAATHASGGSDPITLAQSQVTDLTASLAAKVPATRQIIAGTGLTGGGDMSADRTLRVDEAYLARLQGNLLTAQDASAEDGTTTGWTTFASTVALSTSWAAHGTRSVLVTPTGSGARLRATMDSTIFRALVAERAVISGCATVRNPSTTSPITVQLLISSQRNYWAPAETLAPGEARPMWVVAQLQGDETSAQLDVMCDATLPMQVDARGWWRGFGGLWAMPGSPITGLGQLTTRPYGDDVLSTAWDPILRRPQAVWYDTGIRDVSSLLVNGWTCTQARFQRRNGVVTVALVGLNGTAATAANILRLPSTPAISESYWIGDATAATVPSRKISVATTGWIWMSAGYTSVTGTDVILRWNTVDGRGALPGTLITPAPQSEI